MTPVWQVKALRTATFTIDKSQFTPGTDMGISFDIPVLMTAVWNEETKILIDTGIHDTAWITAHTNPCRQLPEEDFAVLLESRMGWSPADVDCVINTHLHYDHCGNNRLCKNAEFVIQRAEWDCAWSPPSRMAVFYLRELFDPQAMDYFRIRLVDGEAEILPGLIVFPTPGHSSGHQSVLVNTDDGPLCVTGDICNLAECLYRRYPSGITTDFDDVADSFLAIEKRARHILPSHDPLIQTGQTGGFPPARREDAHVF